MPDLTRETYWHCATAEFWETTIRGSRENYVVAWDRAPQGSSVQFDWRCSCPSFVYQRGVDNRGHCKHIRKVVQNGYRCGWSQFMHGDEPRRGPDGEYLCPKCGAEAHAQDWAV